jgi:hypothetical protein
MSAGNLAVTHETRPAVRKGYKSMLTPNFPKTPTPKAPPTSADAGVLASYREEQRLANLRRGMASTRVTGPQGLLASANLQRKTLLGQ